MPRKARRAPSSIDRLPPEIRERIADLRFAHGRTLDEILDHLSGLGADVSRSALHRHVQQLQAEVDAKVEAELAKLSPAMAFANTLASALVGKIERADGDTKLRATRELIQSQIFRSVVEAMKAAEADPEAGLAPKDMFVLSRALQTLAQAERTEETRIREAEQAAAERARVAAMAAVEEVARTRAGLTAETVEAIRHAVLGDA